MKTPNNPSVYQISRRYGGVPAWVVHGYLRDAGGTPIDGDGQTFVGDGWQAEAIAVEPRRVSRLEIEQVDLTITGDRERVETLMRFLMPRIMRGGA